MKCLIDAQLPPRLSVWLSSRGADALHVFQLQSGLALTDEELWEEAKREKRVIITKDRDFFDRVLVSGPPPQVVHIAVGNCSNATLFTILDSAWKEIQGGLEEGSPLVVVTRSRAQIF